MKLVKVLRSALFYNKYVYKVLIEDFNSGLIRRRYSPADINLIFGLGYDPKYGKTAGKLNPYCTYQDRLIALSNFVRKYPKNPSNGEYTYHMTMYSLSFFTNDYDIAKEFAQCDSANDDTTIIYEAEAKVGTKYFSRTPPTQMRVYLKDVTITAEEFAAFSSYIQNEDKLHPAAGFLSHLHYAKDYKNPYLYASFFIGYNDSTVETMLYLKFGELLGKKYQLVKRPPKDK